MTMMQTLFNALKGVAVAGLVAAGAAQAASVHLYVDAAPNVYGSPDYAAWQAAALTGASTGSFVNMANSHNAAHAGTTTFELEDMVVYSFGDLGSRLSWVYWIPNETKASLAGRVQIALSYDWDGTTYDAYQDYYGATWQTPSAPNLFEVNGGVVGIAGWAWWGAYNTNTQAELDADLLAWRPYQGDLNFQVRLLDNLGGVESLAALTAEPAGAEVPEPGSLALASLALLAAWRVRARRG